MRFCASLEGDEETLLRIENDFANAVEICREVGFDAVEVHLGHGYLLSQFLSCRTNPHNAGSACARLQFPLSVLRRVVECARGDGKMRRRLAVLVKFNVSELGGEADLPLAAARLFARSFANAGADLLVPSGGHVVSAVPGFLLCGIVVLPSPILLLAWYIFL
jgi:2,4-dienoyl-CoA reductase-like NADH-dependent reductase (Old Yellow Enzyme family)